MGGIGVLNMKTQECVIDSELIDGVFAKVMVHNDLFVDTDELPPTLDKIIQATPVQHQMLTLIVLLSQYKYMMYKPSPSEQTLTTIPELPSLSLPTLESRWQNLCKKCLSAVSQDNTTLVALVRLLSSRGYTLHPTLWLPTKSFMECYLMDDELSALYMPWYVWQHDGELINQNELTIDNWDEWYPAQRLALLKRWRHDEPIKALEMIKTCITKENATERYKIIQVLTINLSDADQEFLIGLQNDRSQKVVSFASQLLVRLGVYQEDKYSTDIISELNEGFEFSGNKITAKKTNNNKKRDNRNECLKKVNIYAWAKANQLTVSEFILRWDFDKNNYYDNMAFVRNIIDVIDDDQVPVLANKLATRLSKNNYEIELCQEIFGRLTQENKQMFADKLLTSKKDATFSLLVQVCPSPLQIAFETLMASPMYIQLINKIKAYMDKDAGRLLDYPANHDCVALGLLMPAVTARQVLEQMFALGVSRTDPALCTLTLNAKLT